MHRQFLKLTISLLSFLLGSTLIQAQGSAPVKDRFVTGQLIGEMEHVQVGKPYRVGLRIQHEPHWHTYWKSSETGYATSISWDLPPGWSVSEISWPTPQTYEFQGLVEYVYEGEVLLLATIIPPDSYDHDSVEIGFSTDWLMCAESCVPGGIQSSLILDVAETPAEPSPEWAGLFKKTDRQLPVSPENYTLSAWSVPGAVMLEVQGEKPETVVFFDDQAVFQPASQSAIEETGTNFLQVRLPLKADTPSPDRLTGVLAAAGGWPAEGGTAALTIDVPVQEHTPPENLTKSQLNPGILLLAFIGGLILNLMPCVFPVLGIKIMGFVNQAGSSRKKVVYHGLVFTLGVLVSFWVLTAILLVLRSSGSQLGWGFQLQSPGFVLVLAFLLLAFALNMSGLFEVGQSAVGVGSQLTAKSGLTGTFFSGVLATVVATPCAAPFLAPALGAALTLPPATSFLVFTVIALGLSMPYLLLSLFPGLINRLPRPGPWMETFKQVMGFLLYATVAYLLWVLAAQLSDDSVFSPFAFLKVLLSLVLLALGLWIYGRWATFQKKPRTRFTAMATSFAVVAMALLFGLAGTHKYNQDSHALNWENWEPGKAESLSAQGKIVYVDFTARWCVTCQTNKVTVFNSSEVLQAFEENGVVLLKADWTNRDARISKALQSFNRSAVPFNLIYSPDAPEPVVLPEILTPGTVLKALDEAMRK